MTIGKFAAAFIFASVMASAAHADIIIEKAWVRASAGTNKVTAGYAVITNNGKADDELTAVSTPAAMMSEVHQSTHENGIAKMEAVDSLKIPAGGKAELKPGSYHVMVMELMQPLKVGETIDMTFTFKQHGDVMVKAIVMPLATLSLENKPAN